MSLPINRPVRNRMISVHNRVGTLCLFTVCLATVTALACTKSEAKGAGTSDAGTAAADSSTTAAAKDTILTYCDKPNDSATVWAAANHHRSDPLAVSTQEYDGWKVFHVYCYRCHGTDAMGSDIAPNLRHSLGPEGGVDWPCFITTVWNGRPPKGMPTWSTLLDTTQIQDLYAYVTARSMGGLAPGRPHVGKVSK